MFDTRIEMRRGWTYTVKMPNTAYISIFANKRLKAKFYVEGWFAEAPEPEPEPEEPVVPDDQGKEEENKDDEVVVDPVDPEDEEKPDPVDDDKDDPVIDPTQPGDEGEIIPEQGKDN